MPAKPDSHQLATDLRTIVTHLYKKLRSQSSTVGVLSLTERSVISLLDRKKQMLPSELAIAEKITAQSMSQVLNHLLELGLIIRTPSASDKRKVYVSLSQAGYALLKKVRNERDEWLNKALLQTCNEKELKALQQAVLPLLKLVDIE